MRLIYNGKESGNELTVRDCSYHKGCVVRVLQKGCRGVAPVVEPEAKEHAACSRARHGPFLRTTVEGDKEFVVCSLDLISGMTEGMNSSIEELIAGSQLPQVLFQCMRDRQSKMMA